MSDWIDLQLAHSLTGVKAPDELWARINPGVRGQALNTPVRGQALNAPAKPHRRPIAVRWAVPAAIAAGVMVILAQPVREDRVFESSQPTAVVRRMAHEARMTVALPPPMEARTNCGACHTL